MTTTLYRSYVLGADGKSRRAVSLNWLPPLLFLIYLIALQSRFGATLGMRLMHIRVVNVEAPERVGVPLGRAVVRKAMLTGIFFTCLFAAAVLAMAYYVWIIVDLVRKKTRYTIALRGRQSCVAQLSGSAVQLSQQCPLLALGLEIRFAARPCSERQLEKHFG